MKKNIAIVGVGFAGLHCYLSLPKSIRKIYKITLIDKEKENLFTPLLHEVSTGILEKHNITHTIEAFLKPNDTFIHDSVVRFDHSTNSLELENTQSVNYDILVMATGSKVNYFSTKGAKEHSHTLKSIEDALEIKSKLDHFFEHANLLHTSKEISEPLSIVIVGGGPTGVELAAEISDYCYGPIKKKYKKTINFDSISISLVNSSSKLLRTFAPCSSRYAKELLSKKKVKIITNTRITEVTDNKLISDSGKEIKASLIIWAAGVEAKNADCIPSAVEQKNRLLVNNTLQVALHANVFCIGDMSGVIVNDTLEYPMLAQIAKQQGIHVAKNIQRYHKQSSLKEFVFKCKVSLCSLGNSHAIVEIGPYHIKGCLGYLIWKILYISLIQSWKKRMQILYRWFLAKK